MNHPNPIDRDRSIMWSRSILHREFVVFDTETTGLLDNPDAEFVQVGIVSSYGDVLMNSLVKPEHPIPAVATNIHKITNEMAATGTPFGVLFPAIERSIKGQLVVIYNREYDLGLLSRHLLKHFGDAAKLGNWIAGCLWMCAMQKYAAFVGDWNDYHGNYRWQKLPDLSGEGAHDAVADCKSTLQVIRDMAAAKLSTEIDPAVAATDREHHAAVAIAKARENDHSAALAILGADRKVRP